MYFLYNASRQFTLKLNEDIKMIKAVIFDMFETLVTLFTGKTYFSEDIAQDLGIPLEDFRREWHATEKDRTLGRLSMEEGVSIALKKLGIYSEENVNLICQKRLEALEDTFSAIPEESILLLKTLHQKGIKTGLITNTFSDERALIRSSPLYPLFDIALISYEQGLSKPEQAIYQKMLDILNIRPEECLYIGDGGSRELYAAREIGMNALQCTWFHHLAFEPHIPCPLLDDFPQVKQQMDVLRYIDNFQNKPTMRTLTNKELQSIYYGAYFFEELEDGWLQTFQYSKEQMEYFKTASDFWYDRCMASTAKTLELQTEATFISFEYKFLWKGSEDSFEMAIDGQITDIRYVKDLTDQGKLVWELPAGKKDVIIYLPADATVLIRNFVINNTFTPAEKNEKVLWLGDSITQGYGPLRSASTYVSVANRLLNYDIINQGIGGYVYDKKSLLKMPGYNPDKIIVALGTNQFNCPRMEDIEEYYETLISLYGKTIPILCITPIWRGDFPDDIHVLKSFCDGIKKIACTYPNVKIIDGFSLVPHRSEYYLDNLHPNALGCELYGRNLVEAIKKINF